MEKYLIIEQETELLLFPTRKIECIGMLNREIARELWSGRVPRTIVRKEKSWNVAFLSEITARRAPVLKRGSRILYLTDSDTALVVEVVIGIYDSSEVLLEDTRIVHDAVSYRVLSVKDCIVQSTSEAHGSL